MGALLFICHFILLAVKPQHHRLTGAVERPEILFRAGRPVPKFERLRLAARYPGRPNLPALFTTATVPSLLSIICLATLVAFSRPALAAGPDFTTQIQPILELNCVRCHNSEKTKGGLQLDTREAMLEGGDTREAVVPGDTTKSELLTRIHLRPIDEGIMPDEGQALTKDEVELLDAWVRAGAPWPSGVKLTQRTPPALKRVPLPNKPPTSPTAAAAMLDDILKRENADSAVITAGLIDDAAFLRRVTIDLIGRIPTMAEIREFERAGDEYRLKTVEKLITQSRFNDRWTVFMSDMLRIRSDIPGGNQLLAYIHGSIEQAKPYDVLVRELISASGRANSNPAVGYLLGDDAKPMELAAATAQIFLGVRIGCAMCHDHPFDDWRQKDFYHFAAYFGKTKKVQGRKDQMVYTTEGKEMMVLWPPEDKAGTKPRTAVTPRFPFQLAKFEKTPDYLDRFQKIRNGEQQAASSGKANAALDALLDSIEPTIGSPRDPVLEQAKKDSRALDVHADIYRTSELRNQLSQLVTDPHNEYFARAFVNRIWAELIGHGFVEPLDNFSDYNAPHNASTLDFLAREFIASGYDIRSLIRIITLTDAYRRASLPTETPVVQREASEKSFTAAPTRRMLGEVLFDSVVLAGHLADYKWPQGANEKQVSREIRVPIEESTKAKPQVAPVSTMKGDIISPIRRSDGYDLESTLKLDFNEILTKQELSELDSMRAMSDEQIEAEKMAAMTKDSQGDDKKFTTKKVTETIDDNPRFDSSMHMATPAPPAHFLRVFGQPDRTGLGEFRDSSSSLRQQLMMLNGRMTHEASRVGPLEPLHAILEKNPTLAIDYAYQEILTRLPTAEEKSEARAVLSQDALEGMADLRWALLNSHEFRFLP